MHELSILRDLALIVGLAIPVVALAHRVRVPPLVGFLLVGVLIGPHGARLVPDADGVSTLAEVGVVLLLFEVGLELSLSQVLRWGATVLVAGGGQVLGTLAVAAAAGAAFGLPVGQSLFYGALIALSSTAIVTKTYADRAELDTTRARDAIAVLLFQDLAVVPLMLLLPVFAGAAAQADGVWLRLLVGLVAMTALVSGGRLVVRWTLDRIVETRDRELFTLCVGFFAIGTALVAAAAGFSLAIGAFLAGLIISESEHGLQALSDVLPFRALFSGVFFTSIGMLLDLPVAIDQAPLVLGATVVVVLGKTVLTTLAIRARGRSMETAIASGVSLAQIGEFSFVLAAAGLPLGLFAAGHYQIFLVVASVSMMVAPFLIRGARPIAIRIAGMATVEETDGSAGSEQADHAIIVGYGLSGRYLARMLQAAGLTCVVIDNNSALVHLARRDGFTALRGDGTGRLQLDRAGAGRARLIVFAIAAPLEERQGVAAARELGPRATIVVRTRYVRAIDELMRLGANKVVVEEFEASLELFARALESYQIPPARIAHELEAVRSEHYGLLRGRPHPDLRLDALAHLGIHDAIELTEVESGADAVGNSATSLDLRRATGVVQIAVIRGGEPRYLREPDFKYEVGDTAVLVGRRDALDRAAELFRPR